MDEILISIVIPIYNTEKYLKNCLDSVIKQTYKNIEIILVNDGSPDKSIDIMEEYLKKDSRIVIVNKINGGLSSARNAGIKIAKGEYILNVDSDDWIEENTCENLLKGVIEDNSDIVIGNILVEGKNIKKWFDLSRPGVYSFEEYLNEFLKGKAKNSIWNKLVKRELYLKNNIFHPEDISLGEDSSTLLRLVTKSNKITKIDTVIYHYRMNEESMMNNSNKKVLQYYRVFELLKNYYNKNNLKEFWEVNEYIFKYRLFYKAILLVSKEFSRKNDMEDYIIGWEMLEKDLKEMIRNKNFLENISFLEKTLLNVYSKNLKLGDILMRLYKKIKR